MLPRLLDRRRGPWSELRRLRFRAVCAGRELRWAMQLAIAAPTELHAARWNTIARREAARAWRLAHLIEAQRSPTP